MVSQPHQITYSPMRLRFFYFSILLSSLAQHVKSYQFKHQWISSKWSIAGIFNFEVPTYTISCASDHTLEWEPPVGSVELSRSLNYHFPFERTLRGKLQAAMKLFLKSNGKSNAGNMESSSKSARELPKKYDSKSTYDGSIQNHIWFADPRSLRSTRVASKAVPATASAMRFVTETSRKAVGEISTLAEAVQGHISNF